MTNSQTTSSKFGEIAVEMNFVDQIKVDKALVVQERIIEKAGVAMPIGEILVEMGAISSETCQEILAMQKEIEEKAASALENEKKPKKKKTENSQLDIQVSRDKLTVTAFIQGELPVTEFGVDDVKLMLLAEDILFGIADDADIEAFLTGELAKGEEWTIASGTPPVPDAPPTITYHFDTNPQKIGTLNEDGLMDWKERGTMPQVKEGDLLAEKTPGPPGKEGMDVYGQKIPVPKAPDKRFKCSKGARRSEDGMQVHASMAGLAKKSLTGELSVMPTLTIDGNVGLETGHVDFDGHIEVAGTIEKGYRVKGGSLRANEILDAEIEIDGDVTANHGVFGATIRCGGNMKASHVNNADLIVAGDLVVEKEIIESKAEANGRCLIIDGIILASTVSARMGITAMDVGTQASKPSELTVGIDQELERKAAAIAEQIKDFKKALEKLPARLEKLQNRSETINTRLGEVAQEQDKIMVRHWRFQEKLESASMKEGSAVTEKLKQTLADLKAEKDAYDETVAQLMEEDEAISREIEESHTAIETGQEQLDALNTRQEEINTARKESPGVASVKVGGTVHTGNRCTGPHSVLVLQEDLKRLTIVETDKADHEGVKRWRFELLPYR